MIRNMQTQSKNADKNSQSTLITRGKSVLKILGIPKINNIN